MTASFSALARSKRTNKRVAKNRPISEQAKIAWYPHRVTTQAPTAAPPASESITRIWQNIEKWFGNIEREIPKRHNQAEGKKDRVTLHILQHAPQGKRASRFQWGKKYTSSS
jgi:hypothetical protein